MRLKFRDASEVIPGNVSHAASRAKANSLAARTSGYPASYPLNGADDSGEGGGELVGRWDKRLFDLRDAGDHFEIVRKPSVTSADVFDAAQRSQPTGLAALNELNRKHYGS